MKKNLFIFCGISFMILICLLMYSNSAVRFDDSDLLSCGASYLLDPNYKVTPENFSQCVADLFAAPAKLYYYYYDLDGSNGSFGEYFYSNNIRINKKIADIFDNIALTSCSYKEFYNSLNKDCEMEVEYFNKIGSVHIALNDHKSFICISGHDLDEDFGPFNITETFQKYYMTEVDLRADLLAAQEVLNRVGHSAAREME